jgi:hypothetical protein
MQAHCPGPAWPLLLPKDGRLCDWEGVIEVRDCGGTRSRQLALRLEGLPGVSGAAGDGCEPPFARARLLCGPELASLLGPTASAALQRCLAGSSSLPAFLSDVAAAAGAQWDAAAGAAAAPRASAADSAALAAELCSLPPESLASCSDDLSSVTLRVRDSCGRDHLVTAALPPGYPRAPAALLQHDLPWPPLTDPSGGLAALLLATEAAVARAGPLWDELDAIDAACWVLDPPQSPAPRSVMHRRLALGGSLTLWLSYEDQRDDNGDAVSVAAMPAMRVDGPEAAAAPLRALLECAVRGVQPPPPPCLPQPRGWLLSWLSAALGAPPPGPPAGDGGERDAPPPGAADCPSCAICYAFPCPESGLPPTAACDGCRRPFHATCLAECLRAAAGPLGGAAAAATLWGECPYCATCVTVRG